MAVGDLVLPPGYALVSLKSSEATVPHQMTTTFGVRLSGSSLTVANLSSLFTATANALKPLWPTSVHMTDMHALVGSDGPPGAVDTSGDVTGSRVGVSLSPPNVTYIISKRTAFAGRQYRGRLFLPFVNENQVNGAGVLDAGELTVLGGVAVALDNVPTGTPSAGVASWVVLHREPLTGATPLPTTVANHLASSKVATQRRRMER